MITKNHGPVVKQLSIGGMFYHDPFKSFHAPILSPVFFFLE